LAASADEIRVLVDMEAGVAAEPQVWLIEVCKQSARSHAIQEAAPQCRMSQPLQVAEAHADERDGAADGVNERMRRTCEASLLALPVPL
jgi:hypothetical protein